MSDPGDNDMMDLDFTSLAMPAVVEEPPPAPPKSSVPSRLEEVAMLFAEGKSEAACSVLEAALPQEEFGDARELAWGMLFDLYQELSRRQAFETLALAFASKFEKSPPTWMAHADGGAAVGKDGLATVTLSGVLGANAVQPLGKLRDMAGKVPGVRLDLGKVADADDVGCGALLETLRVFKQLKKSCELMGGEQVATTLATKTTMGERTHESTWLLLLELYQNLGRQDAFEDAAVGYAVTFEVSPPSWEAPKTAPVPPAAPKSKPAPAKGLPADCCGFSGEMTGCSREQFAPLVARATSHAQVSLDATGLRRMDVQCAEELGKLLGELNTADKRIRIFGARALLVALWRALGIDQIATIEPPKL